MQRTQRTQRSTATEEHGASRSFFSILTFAFFVLFAVNNVFIAAKPHRMAPMVSHLRSRVCPSCRLWCNLAVFASLWLGPAASASVTRSSPTGVPTTDFPGVGQFGTLWGYDASAVAVGNGQYLLTARHAVTTDSTITGQLREAADLRFKLDGITYTATAVRADFSADLALVTLSTPVPSAAQLWTAANGSEAGQLFIAAGFGAMDANSDGAWDFVRDRQRRQFANRIDSMQTGGLTGQGQVLRYDFDLTTGEAVGNDEGLAGPGDSGGGLFLWDGQRYILAVILSSSGSPVDGASASATRLAPFAATLAAAVPEPAGLTLLMGVPALVLRPRRR